MGAFFGGLPKWAWIALAGAVALAGGLWWHHSRVISHDKAVRAEQLRIDRVAFDQTVANYRAAVEKARQLDAANVARVQAEQSKISQESSDEYEARIAAARATAAKLRQQLASETHSGNSRTTSVSGVPAAASGPSQAAGQDGLSIDDRLTATEQAIQLDELIKWVKKQHAINPNK